MPEVSVERIERLVRPYLEGYAPPAAMYGQLAVYLELLVRWNARTNLTAVREPEAMVQRHFGQSLYAGVQLAPLLGAGSTVLDLGSGAGFPGLPIQLLLPEVRVTLAESQNKKASFLREVVRTLGLRQTEVWAGRAEDLPAEQRFEAVTLRAVDRMEVALEVARGRVVKGGWLVSYGEVVGGGLRYGLRVERVA